ncbi:SCO family protein [Dyella sp.]|jgi:protein SCO1/2|uniref:SCO family protein n=1 Tax=Dyella sp. TaxID=1869338 RepID=UPI002D7A24F0|nr:SCO family protein [Dyella sp.]HET6432787.1 SCO family protein [Dyella sp.]
MSQRMLLAALFALVTSAVAAGSAPVPPPDLTRKVGFDQRLGAPLPMQAMFTDSHGRSARLGEWIGGRPTVLAMGYFHCPNLCDAVLQGMAHAVRGTGLQPGRDMNVLFVSIDPREQRSDAVTSRRMLEKMSPEAQPGRWHFLRGQPAAIDALAAASGYRYLYDASIDQYAHAAGIVVSTGAGRVAQYFFGVRYPPRSLRLALVDASHGAVGNVVDQLVLLCCGYDPSTGRYSLLIGRVMRWLGVGFALALGLGLFMALRRRHRHAGEGHA